MSACKHTLLTVLKARLKTFSIVLTQVYHAVALPNLGVAGPPKHLPIDIRTLAYRTAI